MRKPTLNHLLALKEVVIIDCFLAIEDAIAGSSIDITGKNALDKPLPDQFIAQIEKLVELYDYSLQEVLKELRAAQAYKGPIFDDFN
jgi:hypothetical protein